MASDTRMALLVMLHPKTVENKEKVLATLPTLARFFRRPSNQCSTWSYFTPSTRKGAMRGKIPPNEVPTIIGAVEVYTDSSALGKIQKSPEYQDYFNCVEKNGLYEHYQDLTAWHPTAGFIARKNGEKETGKAGIVMLAKFVCKDGEGMREKLVEVLGNFCDWVEANEPTTYTYCVMTRPKAPNEVLLFERYENLQALGVHGKTKEFKAMFRATGPYIRAKETVLSEWDELEGSFVSNQPGGAGVGGQAKL